MRCLRYACLGLLLTAAGVSACTEDAPTGNTPPATTYTVTTTLQWSGGMVLVRSSQANGGHASRLVLAGDDSVVATAVDDTTYSFTLPAGPSGSVGIRVPRSGGGADTAGTVSRVGFSGTEDMASPYWGFSAWRPGNHPAILGTNQAGDSLISFDLATGVVTDFPGLRPAGQFTYPVSITEFQTAVSTAVGLDSVAITQLYPAISSSDTFEAGGSPRQAIRLSDSVYIETFHHSVVVRSLDNSRLIWTGRIEEPYRTVLSQDGRFATVTGSTSTPVPYGIPVFDAHTGDSLFQAPVGTVAAAVFSPDGGILYVVGGQFPAYDTLRAVNTATGATISTAVLPDSSVGIALTLDAPSGTLYVAGELNGTGEVLVYDAINLTLRGRLPTGIPCGQFCEGTILLDAPAHRLYLNGPTEQPSKILIFDLLP